MVGFERAKRGWKPGFEEIDEDLRSDRATALDRTERHPAETFYDLIQWAKLGWSRTRHPELLVISADCGDVVGEAASGSDSALDHELCGEQTQVPASYRTAGDLSHVTVAEPGFNLRRLSFLCTGCFGL